MNSGNIDKGIEYEDARETIESKVTLFYYQSYTKCLNFSIVI
jgi:hypothetical protein